MVIKTKEEFNRLSQSGKLGNFLRTWNDIDAVKRSGYRGWLTIQSREKQSPHFCPWVSFGLKRLPFEPDEWQQWPRATDQIKSMLQRGAPRDQMYFREVPAPDARRVIQFEGMLGPQWPGAGSGVELFYELDSTQPVRGIRERCKTADGAAAQWLLRRKLDTDSYDMLNDIWTQYPTAIIEATEFSQPCGVFHQHLVIWEVRNF